MTQLKTRIAKLETKAQLASQGEWNRQELNAQEQDALDVLQECLAPQATSPTVSTLHMFKKANPDMEGNLSDHGNYESYTAFVATLKSLLGKFPQRAREFTLVERVVFRA